MVFDNTGRQKEKTAFHTSAYFFKMKHSLLLLLLNLGCFSSQPPPVTRIICSSQLCKGNYYGPEFINGSDIAHQFSNTMAAEVGDKLKELYDNSKYSKVDFSKIKMTTGGMGTGTVRYVLEIPFERVKEKCAAFTSFDHVSGWNHKPALARRKKELANVLLPDEHLNISDLHRTPEGLQEYWIQWKNKSKQAKCAGIT